MPSESHSRSKSYHSDDDRREKKDRRRKRDEKNERGGRHRDGEEEEGSKHRRRDNDRRKKSKKRDRSENRLERHRDSGSDSEGDNKDDKSGDRSKHRDRHHGSREKSSRKRRKKSSRSSSRSDKYYSDENSDSGSDYDKRRSSEKRKKRKKSSSSSKSKHDKRDKKSSKAGSIKKPDKSKLVPMGEPLGRPPETTVNAETDYFTYHNEFWIYLFREEGLRFNDLDTKESRAAFSRFAKDYNAGKLEEPYYSRNFPNEVIEESKTTKHSWGFKTTHAERKGLGDLQKGVRRQTEYSNNNNNNKQNEKANHDVRNLNTIRSSQVNCPPVESLGGSATSKRLHRPTPEERKWRKDTLEELVGGPRDFRERQLEKKRQQAASLHGAHKDKEATAAGSELSDAALFGSDGNHALAKSRQHRERKHDQRQNRIQELQAKEEERKNNMLKMLGLENLKGTKKLEIAPRK